MNGGITLHYLVGNMELSVVTSVDGLCYLMDNWEKETNSLKEQFSDMGLIEEVPHTRFIIGGNEQTQQVCMEVPNWFNKSRDDFISFVLECPPLSKWLDTEEKIDNENNKLVYINGYEPDYKTLTDKLIRQKVKTIGVQNTLKELIECGISEKQLIDNYEFNSEDVERVFNSFGKNKKEKIFTIGNKIVAKYSNTVIPAVIQDRLLTKLGIAYKLNTPNNDRASWYTTSENIGLPKIAKKDIER